MALTITRPYGQKNFMGNYVDDSTADAAITSVGWTKAAGVNYYNTTDGAFKFWNGTSWGPIGSVPSGVAGNLPEYSVGGSGLSDSGKKQEDFLTIDGTRAMTGNLDIGDHNITNVAILDGDTNNLQIKANEIMTFTAGGENPLVLDQTTAQINVATDWAIRTNDIFSELATLLIINGAAGIKLDSGSSDIDCDGNKLINVAEVVSASPLAIKTLSNGNIEMQPNGTGVVNVASNIALNSNEVTGATKVSGAGLTLEATSGALQLNGATEILALDDINMNNNAINSITSVNAYTASNLVLNADSGNSIQVNRDILMNGSLKIKTASSNDIDIDADSELFLNATDGITINPGSGQTVNFSNARITSVGTPTDANDVTTKDYVDSVVSGLKWRTPVYVISLVGNATVATINGLTEVAGDAYVVTDSGDLTEGGTLAVVAGDLVEFDGTQWVKIASASGGYVPSGTRAILSTTTALISPYTDATDDGKIVEFDGTSNTATSTSDATDGSAVFVCAENGYYENAAFVFDGTVPTGVWIQFSGAGQINAGIGLEKDGNTFNVLLGAGIKELPSDEVGIDVAANEGLKLTSVLTAGQLAIDKTQAFLWSGLHQFSNVGGIETNQVSNYDGTELKIYSTNDINFTSDEFGGEFMFMDGGNSKIQIFANSDMNNKNILGVNTITGQTTLTIQSNTGEDLVLKTDGGVTTMLTLDDSADQIVAGQDLNMSSNDILNVLNIKNTTSAINIEPQVDTKVDFSNDGIVVMSVNYDIGGLVLGTTANSFPITTQNNQDIVLDPNGTGVVDINSDVDMSSNDILNVLNVKSTAANPLTLEGATDIAIKSTEHGSNMMVFDGGASKVSILTDLDLVKHTISEVLEIVGPTSANMTINSGGAYDVIFEANSVEFFKLDNTTGRIEINGSGGKSLDLNGGRIYGVHDIINNPGESLRLLTSDTNQNIVLSPNGTGYVDVSSSLISNVTDPSAAQDAATKNYVDTNSSIVSSAAGAPSTTPTKVGNIYVDTTNKLAYVSTGTTNSADWLLM